MSEGHSESTRRVVDTAAVEARRFGHPAVGTEHLLLGLLQSSGPAAEALADGGAQLTAARHRVAEAVTAPTADPSGGEIPFTARAARAVERAARFARQARRAEVDPADVLLGVLDVEGLGCQVLRGIGVDVGRLRDSLLSPAPDDVPDDDGPSVVAAAEPAAVADPLCPRCGAALAETLAVRRLSARGDGGRIDVDVIHCADCGTTVGAR